MQLLKCVIAKEPLSRKRTGVMDSDRWVVVGEGLSRVNEGWWVVGRGSWVVRVVWGWLDCICRA